MAVFCHRCGGELPETGGESTFCPHCGAPQLRISEESAALFAPQQAEAGQQPAHPAVSPQIIVWPTAVRYSALVACLSALLLVGVFWLPALFPIAWLCTICGGAIVLGLYLRRHRTSLVDARAGAKIGLLYGIFAAVALAFAAALAGLVARYGLHTMGTVDTLLANAMKQAAAQQMDKPGGVTLTPAQMQTFFSPEIRAGLALFLMASAAGFLIVFSAAGGAMGGMLHTRGTRRHQPGSN